MANSPKTYQRLTRNQSGVGTNSSLWLAADHLMIVRSSGYHEEYAQLHLGDLRGIFLTETNRRRWWGLFWGALTVLNVVGWLLNLGSRMTPAAVIFAILAGLCGVGLLWNHLLGPGCRAYALTGVQTAELPALVRMKKARKVVARLEPLVAAAQAHLVGPPEPPGTTPEPPPPAPAA